MKNNIYFDNGYVEEVENSENAINHDLERDNGDVLVSLPSVNSWGD